MHWLQNMKYTCIDLAVYVKDFQWLGKKKKKNYTPMKKIKDPSK